MNAAMARLQREGRASWAAKTKLGLMRGLGSGLRERAGAWAVMGSSRRVDCSGRMLSIGDCCCKSDISGCAVLGRRGEGSFWIGASCSLYDGGCAGGSVLIGWG